MNNQCLANNLTSPVETSAERPGDATSAGPLAVFDLDGTLTTSDSFLAFLLTFGKRHARYRALASTPFWIAAYLGRLMKDYQLKQRLIANFVAGVDPAAVSEHSEWFCEQWLPGHLHPIGHRLLQAHQNHQHRVILLSASPDIFVPRIAQALGIAEVICTRVRRVDGRWQGQLDGLNCKGQHKLELLQQHLKTRETPAGSFSYGDSKSDLAVLRWVEHGAWIRSSAYVPLDGNSHSAFPELPVS